MTFGEFRIELKKMFFSQRQRVFRELERIAREDSGVNVAWPDVLLFVDDGDVRRAISKSAIKEE